VEYVSKKTVSAQTAQQLLEASVAKAQEIQVPMCIAVVDDGGNLKALLRMDGAPLVAISVAIDKAYTSAAQGITTAVLADVIKDDAPLTVSVPASPNITPVPGGFPLFADGALIGGLGVSGGYYTDDVKVGEAALEGVGAEASG
jgi:uncharacterized protein GlcG (DUF336 family)